MLALSLFSTNIFVLDHDDRQTKQNKIKKSCEMKRPCKKVITHITYIQTETI